MAFIGQVGGTGNAANNACARLFIVPDQQGIQAVLWFEGMGNRRISQAYVQDAPKLFAFLHVVVGIDGLMTAMKGTGAEMDNAHRHVLPRVGRSNDMVGHMMQGGAGQSFHGSAPYGRYVGVKLL